MAVTTATPKIRPNQSPGATAGTQASSPKPNQTVPVVPFTRASRQRSMQAFDISQTMGASTITLNPIEIPAAGYLRYIDVYVEITSAGNSAATAFAADAPWNALGQVSVTNAAGDSMMVPLSGYNVFLLNKYGAFADNPPYSDPRATGFSTTTGSGATGGSAKFVIRIPFEIDPRDAFCAVPNMAANRNYLLNIQIAPTSSVYTTAPTNAPTIRLVGIIYSWGLPNGSNAVGTSQATEPMGNGSVSLLRYATQTISGGGDKLLQISNVGNVIRLLMFVLRDSSGSRIGSVTDWPATSYIVLNNDNLFYFTRDSWLHDMAKYFGYTATGFDTVGALDTGVFIVPYLNSQRGIQLSDGPRDQYLPTLDATQLQIRGTSFGSTSSTLEIVTNEIKPSSAAALYSPNIS